jgi:rare lipoprotein A
VQVGAFSSRPRAEALAQRIGASVSPQGNLFRVRYGPFATEAEARAAVQRARSAGQPGAVIVRER